MAKQKADLATLDRELCDIVLKSYPGKIFENQYKADDSDPDAKVYRFFGLEKNTLQKFLSRYRQVFEYEILDAKTGEQIEVNKIDRPQFYCMQWYEC